MTDKELALQIIALVGGEKNIAGFTNCVTRLRFNLKNDDKASPKEIEKLSGVLGVQNQGGQFQVIVGGKSAKLAALVKDAVSLPESDDNVPSPTKKKGILTRLFDTLSSILIPSLPPIIGGGMIKGFLFLFWELGWLEWGSPTFNVLNIISDGMFYFYPFLLAVSAAKKFKTNKFMALALAGSLMHPIMMEGVNEGLATLPFLGFLKIPYLDYSSSVIPIILSVWLLSYVYRFFEKRIPDILSVIFTPMLTLLLVVPIQLVVLAPLGFYAGEYLAYGLKAVIDFSPLLSGFIIGAIRPFTVLTGMHHAVRAIVSQQIATYGYTTIGAMNYMSTMAQAAAALGVYLVVKDKNMKHLSLSAAVSGFLGVTEPAMYSVIIKYKIVFIATSIGGGVGAAISSYFGGAEYAMVMSSLLTIPATFGNGFIGIAIGLPVSIVVTMAIIMIFGKGQINREVEKENTVQPSLTSAKTDKQEYIGSPVSGTVSFLSSLEDKTYAEEIIGKGVSIQADIGEIRAPFDGVVENLFHTNHAIGLVSSTGIELLIHVGIDTVKLKGTYFTPQVKSGDTIAKGDLILCYDKEAIEKAGYESGVVVVVTNTGDYLDVLPAVPEGTRIARGDNAITVIK